jgi:hypothetical protein
MVHALGFFRAMNHQSLPREEFFPATWPVVSAVNTRCTKHVQFMYSTYTERVSNVYSSCTLFIHMVRQMCTVHIQCVYTTVTYLHFSLFRSPGPRHTKYSPVALMIRNSRNVPSHWRQAFDATSAPNLAVDCPIWQLCTYHSHTYSGNTLDSQCW